MKYFTLVPIVLPFALSASAQSPLKSGAWELQLRVTVAASDTSAETVLHEERSERCMTTEFIATNPYLNPDKGSQKPKGGECKTSDYNLQGSSATWKMVCTASNGLTVRGSVHATVNEKDFESGATNEMTRPDGMSQTVRFKNVGRYIGECKAGTASLGP